MLILPRNIQALACCAGACLQSSFCTWGNFNRRKWGFFNRRKLGNIQPALTLPTAVFSSPGWLVRFSCWDMPLILSAQVEAKSRNLRYSFEGNQTGVLPQSVTTVWRTELGTTLLNGFNSTTDKSAYFHYLCLYQSATNARDGAEFLSRMASQHAGPLLLRERLFPRRPSFATET